MTIANSDQPILANASAADCLTHAVATPPRAAPPDFRRLRHHLDRVGVEPATAVARAAHHVVIGEDKIEDIHRGAKAASLSRQLPRLKTSDSIPPEGRPPITRSTKMIQPYI